MPQGNLFDYTTHGHAVPAHLPAPEQLARTNDPETSKAAARSITQHLTGLYQKILEMVRATPGLTATELASKHNIHDPRTVNRRLGEMEKDGRLRRGEPKKCSITGKMAATWWVAADSQPTE